MDAAVSPTGAATAESNPPPPSGTKRKRNTDEAAFACTQCSRSFGRVEHLRRHVASHGEERSFHCTVCFKSFNRLDTLQRHELIHQKNDSVSKLKGARACKECAAAKARCSGSHPCERCYSKRIECAYPRIDADSASYPPPLVTTPSSSSYSSRAELMVGHSALQNASLDEIKVPFPERKLSHADSLSSNYWTPSSASATTNWTSNAPSPGINSAMTGVPQHMNALQLPQSACSPTSTSFSRSDAGTMQPNGPTNCLEKRKYTSRHWLDTVVGHDIPMEPSTPSSGSQATSGAGRYYVDGDGGRLPKVGLQRRMTFRGSISTSSPDTPKQSLRTLKFDFPLLHSPVQENQQDVFTRLQLLSEKTYLKVYDYFTFLCTTPSPYYAVFQSSHFPSRDTLNSFMQLYLEFFQPLVPILHFPTLNLDSSHCLLSLALATIGSHFADFDHAGEYASSMNEFLRRSIQIMDAEEDVDLVDCNNVKLLSCIGMMYSGEDVWQKAARCHFVDLVAFCRTDWVGEDKRFTLSESGSQESTESDWRRWTEVETRRRTGYAIWLIDAMWAYQFQVRPRLALEDGTIPLPCQEVLWEAESAVQWRHVYGYSPHSPSLTSATYSIYVEKKLQPTMGEFSRIILIHALYQRSWEVEGYYKQPLSGWMPTAEQQDFPISQDRIWLPHNPMFSRWRNSTCDCLDTLHWSANSVIGAASGLEHPTVMHLHLARIILLTPFRDICNLAYGMTKEDSSLTAEKTSEHRNIVRRWALEDKCKARLAMIHAGALFWHVRRYSASGFYEPSAVMLSALALWAYGTFSGVRPPSIDSMIPEVQTHGEAYATSINLDRPADDELVQTFITRGDLMQALITGVGDIRSPHGPERVLLEGSKLVTRLTNWGSSRKAMRVLNNLSLCRQHDV